MSFTDIKNKNQGFTIVELLIVVVVIAILAAITIVSYNGITNRANASAAASTAASFQKKAELFASDGPTANYPRALTDLTGGSAGTTVISANPALSPAQTTTSNNSWYIGYGTVNISSTDPTNSNGKDTIRYQPCGNQGTSTAPASIAAMKSVVGGIISYYNFQDSTIKTINIGTTTTGGNPNNTCSFSAGS